MVQRSGDLKETQSEELVKFLDDKIEGHNEPLTST